MQKWFVYGFHRQPSQRDAILSLQKKGLIKVPLWLGEGEIPNLQSKKVWNKFDLNSDIHAGQSMPVDKNYYHTLVEFMEMYSCTSFSKTLSPQELQHIAHISYDYYSNLLMEHQIDLVIYDVLPHDAGGLLYRAAKNLGIKTLICYQSIFNNRFFFCWDMKDFGYFKNIEPVSELSQFQIKKEHETDLFYMTNQKFLARKIKLHNLYGFMLKEALREISRRFKKSFPLVSYRRKRNVSFSRILHTFYEYREFEKLQKLAKSSVDMQMPYVYFPLHLQPESSTSSMGVPYFDQLLAIEYLVKLLPKEWKIYVKENPKQGRSFQRCQHRGAYFRERLARITQAIYLDPSINTWDLMRHSKFVATVNGTAGWEAIKGGKPALVFSNTWYVSLPGVFRFTPDMSLKEILAFEGDHTKFQKACHELLKKSAIGIIDPDSAALSEDGYNDEKNKFYLEEFLQRIAIAGCNANIRDNIS